MILTPKNQSIYGGLSVVVGIVAFYLTFASGFGPCGPDTGFGLALMLIAFLGIVGGALTLVASLFRAVFGRK
jgi:hypothetical protein